MRARGRKIGTRWTSDRARLQKRDGRLIDSQEGVGGDPEAKPVRRALDIPKQNVEAWLARLAAELE